MFSLHPAASYRTFCHVVRMQYSLSKYILNKLFSASLFPAYKIIAAYVSLGDNYCSTLFRTRLRVKRERVVVLKQTMKSNFKMIASRKTWFVTQNHKLVE